MCEKENSLITAKQIRDCMCGAFKPPDETLPIDVSKKIICNSPTNGCCPLKVRKDGSLEPAIILSCKCALTGGEMVEAKVFPNGEVVSHFPNPNARFTLDFRAPSY